LEEGKMKSKERNKIKCIIIQENILKLFKDAWEAAKELKVSVHYIQMLAVNM